MNFKSFNLKEDLIDALEKLGYTTASQIQELVIPRALKDKNLIVKSMTGSGKTHCFIIPILNNLNFQLKQLQAIVISPTRELAKQTYDFFSQFENFYKELNVKLLIGGHQKKDDLNLKNNPPQIIIATPKRLKDILVEESVIKLGFVNYLILDEVDMMMDLGYFNDIDTILSRLKAAKIMVFSASYPNKILHLLKKYIDCDEIISLGKDITNNNVVHYAIDRKHQDIKKATLDFINKNNPYFLLIFCSYKKDVSNLYDYLIKNGIKCGILHGDLTQRERKNTLKLLKNGNYHIVVCSDMASRGLDFKDVSDVLNYDLPNNEEFYFHRAGRCGRMNNQGNCYTFYNVDTLPQIEYFQKSIHFNFLTYKNGDFISSSKAKKVINKKKMSEEEIKLNRDIKLAKSKATTKKVKPNYKKKVKLAVEKVVKKYKKDKIRKEIHKQIKEKYRKGSNY